MSWWTKSRNNKNTVRLLRQVAQSKFEEREYNVKRIRKRAYEEQVYDMWWYDLPDRSCNQKNWKCRRQTQWK